MGTHHRALLILVLALAPRLVRAEVTAEAPRPSVIAARLIQADRWEDAERVLTRTRARAEARADDDDPVDLVEVEALLGLVDLHHGRSASALERFERVLAERPNRTATWLYLGQARFDLGDHAGAVAAFDRAGDRGLSLPGVFVLRARAEEALGRAEAAWGTLERGLGAHPGHAGILRERARLLLSLGLFASASEAADAYLEQVTASGPEAASRAFAVLAEALQRAGRVDQAVLRLEEARARFPDDGALTWRLAYAYARAARHRSAARLFEGLSAADPSAAHDAADQYRLAGRARDALRMNARVAERPRQETQRLSILVTAGRHHTACAMRSAFGRPDDATRVQLGYACLHAGQPDLAARLLEPVREERYRARAQAMRAAITECRQDPLRCP
jgi:tetratricopeptide (TPR) repeat protein